MRAPARWQRLVAVLLAGGALAACGLKGPLSMPEKPGEVVIRGPKEPPPATPEPTPPAPASPQKSTSDKP